MKKLVLTSFVVFSFLSSFGQFNKGRILVGGTGVFLATTEKSKSGNTTTTTGKTTTFSLGPTVGYFLMDNFAAGLGLSFWNWTYKSETSTAKSSTKFILIAPFVRYYLKPGIFFEGTYGIGPSKISYTTNVTTETSPTISRWSLGAGYAWFLNDHVAVEPTINYSSTVAKTGGDKSFVNGFNFGLGLQVYLGAK